ncbi:MAG TPA: hypothetical protein ENI42_04205 [Thermoplasmatales archaeon]|nr:hypothetical protein [Thermoplasmatales archaeon]
MQSINELISKVERYTNTIVQREFISRKNTVAYVLLDNKPRVLKWFAPAFKRNMRNEWFVLRQGSSALNIPHPYEIDSRNNVLIMSYILGENLCDLINDEKTTTGEKQRLMILLADWFAHFHVFFKDDNGFRIRGDSMLRNFIFSDRIWGVDFEESRVGKPSEDIAGMCSSILSTDPMFTTEKFQLCEMFIESYSELVEWELEDINDEIAYALLEKIQWRPEQEKILRRYARRIQEQGLLVNLL